MPVARCISASGHHPKFANTRRHLFGSHPLLYLKLLHAVFPHIYILYQKKKTTTFICRYVESVAQLSTKEELALTKAAVDNFASGAGPKLHAILVSNVIIRHSGIYYYHRR